METIALVVALKLAAPKLLAMHIHLSCEEAQHMIIRLHQAEGLTERQRSEVEAELLGVAPVSCAVPQLTTTAG